MKLAVTHEEGNVFGHFGHTEEFKIFEVEDGKILSSEIVKTNGVGHGALANFLKNYGVDTLICGGIGAGAKMALSEQGITLYPGVVGNVEQVVEDFLAKKLQYHPDEECNHHSHEHGEDHECHCHKS